MRGNKLARVARLEAVGAARNMSERVKAWLGLRPPLTPEESAAEPVVDWGSVDWSGFSPGLRAWLEPTKEKPLPSREA